MRQTSKINKSKIGLVLLIGALMIATGGCASSNGGQDAGPSDADGTNGSDGDGANGSDDGGQDAGPSDADGTNGSDGDGANGSDDGGQNGDFDGWVINFPAGLQFCQWNALAAKSAPYGDFEGKIRILL